MSHVTKVKTRIRDRKILLAALDELGCDYEETGEIRFDGMWRRVDVAVWKRGGFRIGLCPGPWGRGYQIHALGLDWGTVKDFRDQLQRQYARKKLLAEARRHHYVVAHEQVCEDNRIRLVLRKVD